MIKLNKKIVKFIFFLFIIVTSTNRNIVNAEEQLYIPYNNDQWFSDWRTNEFDSNPVDICFVIDDSGSTDMTDANHIRNKVVKAFISNLRSEDRYCIATDHGSIGGNILLYPLGNDYNTASNILDSNLSYGDNCPAHSIDAVFNQLSSSGNNRNKMIVHIGDGAFAYNYDCLNTYIDIDDSLVTKLKNSGIRMYTIGFANDDVTLAELESQGTLKKMASLMNGKYYRLIIEKNLEVLCKNAIYKMRNTNECCKVNPSECCEIADFTDNVDNWNKYFEGTSGEKNREICCNNSIFKSKYSNSCSESSTPIETNPSDEPVVKQKTCSDPTYNKDNYCACKKFECNENFTKDCTGKFINDMYQVIKIVVSVLLVVLTIMDMVKAMVAGNDEGMKKNVDTAKKRIIIVIVLLFGPALINLLLGLISNGNWSTCGIK